MTFAAEVDKPNSSRFMLAQIGVGWRPPAAEWSGGGVENNYIWSLPIDYRVYSVAGSTLAGEYPEYGSLAALTSWGFFYDESARILYVWDATATPNSSEAVWMVVNYYLTVASGAGVYSSIEPDATPAGSFYYEPRIVEPPAINQSWENVLAGVFTIAENTIQLSNADSFLQPHMGDNYSLSNKALRIWFCANGVENCQRVYTGRTRAVSISGKTASISFFDAFSRLQEPALMGDPAKYAFARLEFNATLNPLHENRPIKYLAGRLSYVKYRLSYISSGHATYVIQEAEPASNTNYTNSVSTSNNRSWVLCRTPASTFRSQGLGTLEAEFNLSTTVKFLRLSTTGDAHPGEFFAWISGGTRYALIARVGTFSYLSVDYNLILFNPDFSILPNVTGASIVSSNKPTIIWRDSSSGFDWFVRPDGVSITYTNLSTLGGTNYLASLTLSSNFTAMRVGPITESTESVIGALDPDADEILFVAAGTTDCEHGTTAKRILEACGIDVDAASVTAANASLPIKTFFTIPEFDESDYRTHREYLAEILKSAGSYVRINSDQEAEYHLLDAPGAGSVTSDDKSVIAGSTTIDVDYSDVAYELSFSNPHNLTYEALGYTTDVPSIIETDMPTKFLHSAATSQTFRHVLESISDRSGYLLSLKKQPRTIYTYKTSSEHLALNLGDDVTLESSEVIDAESVDLKATASSKSISGGVTVTAEKVP